MDALEVDAREFERYGALQVLAQPVRTHLDGLECELERRVHGRVAQPDLKVRQFRPAQGKAPVRCGPCPGPSAHPLPRMRGCRLQGLQQGKSALGIALGLQASLGQD